MNTLKIRYKPAIFAITLSLFCFSASADVRIDQEVEITAGGMLSMMNSTTSISTLLQGDKSRSKTSVDASGRLGKYMSNKDQVSIARLDKELVWTLAPSKKTYTEMTFAELRAQMEKSMEQMESMQKSGRSSLPVDEENCEWSPAVVKSSRSGEKIRIAGVKAAQHITTVERLCTDKKTGKACKITWSIENWMAKKMPAEKEINAFRKKALKKMGFDEYMPAGNMSAVLTDMFSNGRDDALEETAQLKGYPLKTILQMDMGGENCTTSNGQTMAMDDVWGNAANAGLNAGVNSAASEAGYAAGREIGEATGNSVGGRVAGSALGAASGEMIGGLFNKFKKKKKNKPVEQSELANKNPAADSTALFRIVTEVIRIDDDAVAGNEFEVPAGYKKTKVRGL